MPSKAFNSAKNKLLAKQFGANLGEKFKANEQEFSAARVGDSLVSIEGQLYPGAVAGDAGVVTNAGRPAAAQYTPGGGGVVVVSGGSGGSGSASGSALLDVPGTLHTTSINQAAGQHTHAIDLTIARAPAALTVTSINENTTVGHTHLIDGSSDPNDTSKILKTSATGQLFLREVRVRDALGSSTGLTHDGVGLKLQHGLRSDPDDRTSYSGRAAWGYVGYGNYAGFAHRDFASQGNYALLQGGAGYDPNVYLNAPYGYSVRHRINNGDVLVMNQSSLSVSANNAATLKSDNYVSQLTGWGITYPGAGDFRYLYTDEMHAKTFIADLEQALAGGQIICKSVTTLARDWRAPYPGCYSTLYVDDLPSAENMQVFQANDYVRIRQFDRSGGSLSITNCWGTVSSPADLSDKQQSWRYTRSGSTTYASVGTRGGSGVTSASGTSIALSKPSDIVSGDVIVVGISYLASAGQTVTAPAGWVQIFKRKHDTASVTLEAWYKVTGGSEPSSYTFTLSAATAYAATIKGYFGCLLVSGSPVDSWQTQSNAATTAALTGGAYTPLSAKPVIIMLHAIGGNIRSTPQGGPLSEVYDNGSTGIGISHYNTVAAVQTSVNISATLASAADSVGAAIFLLPAYTSGLTTETGMMTPGATIGAKAIVLDYGVSGNGFYEVNAIDGLYGDNSPYWQIVTWEGHPATGQKIRARGGNLKGLFGVANEYGLMVGEGIAVTDKYLRLGSHTNEIHNLPIKMYDGSNLFFQADTSGLTYYVQPTGAYADNTSILFRRPDGTKILQLTSAGTPSTSHQASVWVQPGSSDSILTLLAAAPSGKFSNVVIQNTVGGSSSQWLFQRLSDGTVKADFPGSLLVSNYVGIGISAPNYRIDVVDRMRVRTGSDGTAGVWLSNAAGDNRAFVGLLSDDSDPGAGFWVNGNWRVWSNTAVTTVTNNLVVNGNLGTWSTPAYGTNWGDYGGSYGGIRYRKLGDMVMLQGLANASASPAATIVTLPAGYVPASNRVFAVSSSAGIIRMDVNTTGTITTPGTTLATGSWISMNGVTFSTT